ncbi:MAG: DUF885 domain-containing protein [Nevskiaceae bacterium]|nr:MAG: DUF885 domain-containing protein [Nevskiaceae bacterium]
MKKLAKGFAGALLAALAGVAAAAEPAWVTESNRNAQVLLTPLAQFSPESAQELGVDGYDEQVTDLKPQVYERSNRALETAVADLQARRGKTSDAAVLQDLDILIKAGQDNLASAKLQHDLLLPYTSVSRLVFSGVRALLDARIPAERQTAALARLRRYAGLEPGTTPITELAKARSSERFDDKNLVGPFRGEVEQDLADSPRLIDGLRQLFAASKVKGYEPALDTLTTQLKDYDAWVTREILPRARADHRLPPALYADNLKQVGVDVAPDELMRRALVSFEEIQNELRALAPLVAKQKGLKTSDYRDVIRALKQQQVQGKAILPLYTHRLHQIEDILRREHEITVPQRNAAIRLASEAESAMLPAPNMSPPRLIGNTGEYGEFVLPLKVPGKAGEKTLQMDDFTFDAAAWTLTAHEARPGHELQFAAMIEKGVSIARAVFAFNSVNVEGWALYSEAEMKPYMPLDGQLIGLQHRLLRAARAYLDPMVNLGLLTPAQVHDVLVNEVCLSEGMAKQEVDRYTYRSPGQATAYFVGYQALMETRRRAELALMGKFDKQRFHDFVLSQGLLPPALLQKAVMEQFVPAELARS